MTSLHVGFERIITYLRVLCFTIFALDSSIAFHPLTFSYNDPFSGLLLSSHHHCTSHYQFDFLFCLVIVIIFTLGTLGSMTHGIFCTCCISYMRAWVFYHWVFGPSFPSFLLPYHLNLCYIPCFKTTLRPWDQMSSSTPLLGRVFEIWLIFGCHHASSLGGRCIDVWVHFSSGFGWLGLHVWWLMIWCCLIFSDLPPIQCHTRAYSVSDEIYRYSWSCLFISTYEVHTKTMTCLLSYHNLPMEPFLIHSVRLTLFGF